MPALREIDFGRIGCKLQELSSRLGDPIQGKDIDTDAQRKLTAPESAALLVTQRIEAEVAGHVVLLDLPGVLLRLLEAEDLRSAGFGGAARKPSSKSSNHVHYLAQWN